MTEEARVNELLQLGAKLTSDVLGPMKEAFVGKDEIIDLLGICLVARENLFILGPPGTAKSALVQQLARRIEGKMFDYLLTRFSEPNEIFGPFDIRKLRDGELVTNTEGMLPEATFVFLDELLNANSAILNSLLLVLNERVFRRGRETRHLPTLMVVGASNCLPQDDALGALFDRFLLRVRSDNVNQEELGDVLSAGWKLDQSRDRIATGITVEDVQQLSSLLTAADLSEVRSDYVELVHRLRHAGVAVSDRRAVKLQRILAASAILSGRLKVNRTDMWVLKHIWDTEEQQDVLKSIIGDVLQRASDEEKEQSHPRSQSADAPDPQRLADELDRIASKIAQGVLQATEKSYVRDQLGLLASRCQWVADSQQREFLQQRTSSLLDQLGEAA
ncbi:AAA family ATPase [Blastopirellula sp. JC732]|uniref:AAA family ATPase n=1 Tax=Blastopirellula sediminis TaxID=2894196 RepID=A0A9X1MHI2_9BACT|nr:AAA family ATPase [Blastopirellula sediminis]MCC9607994.1 AAA family ATPase [Blastopirellula sediminis]MCC9627213.1 AAA family ATPase [Blastopirellula sediminis]